ncbi:MAG: hypothetical protein JSS62_04955 [Verrucomicrobia bacterium]|nr:hypothetical protein [Verrucomicrobiota bacterium]MBS0647502.1 hypothetical protein [Verrucomicrobiota bacterium]
MVIFKSVTKLIHRFRYPGSMPEDVAHDLGYHLSNTMAFSEFLQVLGSSSYRPTRLWKMMPRPLAEMAFTYALKKETFRYSTLFSYSFNHGWLVFALYFDEHSRLRRLFVQCPSCISQKSFDIFLDEEMILAEASSH